MLKFLQPVIDYLQSLGADEEQILLTKEEDAALCAFCQTTKVTKHQDTHSTGFSCDWENWNQIFSHIKAPQYYDLSEMDMSMKCLYGLAPPIRPIAYIKSSPSHEYIFESNGKYYFWIPDTEDLWLLRDAQTDDNALDGSTWRKGTELMVAAEDGYKKVHELEGEQMELAKRAREANG